MPSATPLYTVDDVRAMPDDGNRYEVINGELFVTPGPSLRHQAVLGRLHLRIGAYVAEHSLGEVFFAPTDVVLGATTLVQPDLLFVLKKRRRILTEQELIELPDLAVEVVSPSSARTDRGRKRELYLEQGAVEYWVVDAEMERVEVWRPGATRPQEHTTALEWQPVAQVEAPVIDLREVFKR